MRICDGDNSSLVMRNLFIHLGKLLSGELSLVKNEILVVLSVQDIHPVYVDGESILLKVIVSLDHDISRNVSILAEMVAKVLNWGQRGIPSNFSQVLELFLR